MKPKLVFTFHALIEGQPEQLGKHEELVFVKNDDGWSLDGVEICADGIGLLKVNAVLRLQKLSLNICWMSEHWFSATCPVGKCLPYFDIQFRRSLSAEIFYMQ